LVFDRGKISDVSRCTPVVVLSLPSPLSQANRSKTASYAIVAFHNK